MDRIIALDGPLISLAAAAWVTGSASLSVKFTRMRNIFFEVSVQLEACAVARVSKVPQLIAPVVLMTLVASVVAGMASSEVAAAGPGSELSREMRAVNWANSSGSLKTRRVPPMTASTALAPTGVPVT